MIHTRPNLMRNVGCCYGNSIRWNFSLLASLWHYSLKRTSWKGALQWGQRQSTGDGSVHLFFDRRECNSIMKPHQLVRGQKAKILSWDFFETLRSLSLWPDLEIMKDDHQISYVKNAGLRKKKLWKPCRFRKWRYVLLCYLAYFLSISMLR